MNHHRKILHTLFEHLINNNILPKDVERVFGELGAEMNSAHSGKLHVALNGHSVHFSQTHHSLPKEEVMEVRKFIETCGVDLERDYPLKP